jgi:hypothetical protein
LKKSDQKIKLCPSRKNLGGKKMKVTIYYVTCFCCDWCRYRPFDT